MVAAPHSGNRLLASLSPEDYELLRPHLRVIEMVQGSVLVEGGGRIQQAYFPHSGIISLVVRLEIGASVEVAMIGRDGLFGASSALDRKISLNTAIVQLDGNASVLNTVHLRAAAYRSRNFRVVLMRHEQVILAQAQQSAACNASHSIHSRLSRWLLRARDLSGSDTMSFTQEFLAQMLGAQRNSVSSAASAMQKEGLIRYHRGNIEIVDLDGLKYSSCECYAAVKRQYDQILKIH